MSIPNRNNPFEGVHSRTALLKVNTIGKLGSFGVSVYPCWSFITDDTCCCFLYNTVMAVWCLCHLPWLAYHAGCGSYITCPLPSKARATGPICVQLVMPSYTTWQGSGVLEQREGWGNSGVINTYLGLNNCTIYTCMENGNGQIKLRN